MSRFFSFWSVHRATQMPSFVLLLAFLSAFLRNEFACSNAVPIPAQGSHNVSESKMTLVAPWPIDGSRAVQAADGHNDGNEERSNLQANTLVEKSNRSPFIALKARQMLDVSRGTLVALNGLKSSATRFGTTVKGANWKIQVPVQKMIMTFKLAKLLSRTDHYTDQLFEDLARQGYSPFSMQTMIDIRQKLKLPKLRYMPEREKEDVNNFNQFAAKYLKWLGDNPEAVDASIRSWGKTSDAIKKNEAKLLVRTKKLLNKGTSIDKLLSKDVSPFMYAEVVAPITYHKENRGELLKSGTFPLYYNAYKKKLMALLNKGKTTSVAPQ